MDAMRMHIQADGDLTPEEASAVHAALERYAATSRAALQERDEPGPWARAARARQGRGAGRARSGGRGDWQASRDRRRRAKEGAT